MRLDILKYPIEEFRLPTDDNYRNETYSQKMLTLIAVMKLPNRTSNKIKKAKKVLTFHGKCVIIKNVKFYFERVIRLCLKDL